MESEKSEFSRETKKNIDKIHMKIKNDFNVIKIKKKYHKYPCNLLKYQDYFCILDKSKLIPYFFS